jgi:hypothetical protein
MVDIGNGVHSVIIAIKFKRSILNLDIQSRTVLLKRCLELFEHSEIEMDIKFYKWLQKLITTLCDETEKEIRKSEAKSPDIWKELFEEFHSYQKIYILITMIGNI